jgi:hypothetical protein
MALDYYLTIQNIDNKISPEQLRESLADAVSFQTNAISDILMKPGLTANVFEEDDEESAFGSPCPDICVAFRIDKFEQYEKGVNAMLRAVFWLMSCLKGDMILTFDTEEVVFQRISGELMFSDDPEFWSASRLSLFNLPCQSGKRDFSKSAGFEKF